MAAASSIQTDLDLTAPTVDEIERIASVTNPVLRNLLITQCYYQHSIAFAKRTDLSSNWCTFATWASKQAGQTIRKEDMQRNLTALLEKDANVKQAVNLLASIAKQFGAVQALEQLQQSTFFSLVNKTANHAADAVARGNKKVFEEIALQFSRFCELCFADEVYSQEHLDVFVHGLTTGPPPDGQDYLRRAFSRYYRCFFETDPQIRAELCFLANLEIGFHEQTRLQPEIAEALNAAFSDVDETERLIHEQLFSKGSFWSKLRLFLQRIFGRTKILDNAIASCTQLVQLQLRRVLTDHLMTLTIPPNKRLQLGKDLDLAYPDCLKELHLEELLSLLKEVDPTPGSLLQSGAADWANFRERIHFITELFRCHHMNKELFSEAFTVQQVNELKAGRVPGGSL